MADWKSTAQFSEDLKILLTGRRLEAVAKLDTEALCTISDPSGYRKIAALVVPYYLEARKGTADYGGNPEVLIPEYWINTFKKNPDRPASVYVDFVTENLWGRWRTWVDTYGGQTCPVQLVKAKADAETNGKTDAKAAKKKKAAADAAKGSDSPKRGKDEEPATGPEPETEALSTYQSEYSGAVPTETGPSIGIILGVGLAIGVVGVIVWKLWRRK